MSDTQVMYGRIGAPVAQPIGYKAVAEMPDQEIAQFV
jgi:hypothetical protein